MLHFTGGSESTKSLYFYFIVDVYIYIYIVSLYYHYVTTSILPQDPTLGNTKLGNQAIDRFKKEKLITQKIADGLKTSYPKSPHFYITPKIRKPGNPVRAVVSSVNCHRTSISEYIEYHLQPVVKQTQSYINGTNDFINKINDIENNPPSRYLVTMDVKSLYTNIPNSEGIAEVNLKKSIATKVITTYLTLIFTLNI